MDLQHPAGLLRDRVGDERPPSYPESQGPRILLDGAHHNVFIQWDFIKPFADLAEADGYRPMIDDETFTLGYLTRFDIVMVITALPFDFKTREDGGHDGNDVHRRRDCSFV